MGIRNTHVQAWWACNTRTLEGRSGSSEMILGSLWERERERARCQLRRMIWRTVCSPWKRRLNSPNGVRKWENEMCSQCHLVKTSWHLRGKDWNIIKVKLRYLVRRTALLETLLDKPKKMMYDFGVKVKFRIEVRPQTKSPYKKAATLARTAAYRCKPDQILPSKKMIHGERGPSTIVTIGDKTNDRTNFRLMNCLWVAVFNLRGRAWTFCSTVMSTGFYGLQWGCNIHPRA